MKWVVWIWTALAVIIPALVGFGLMTNPQGMPGAEMSLEDVASMAGVRNIVFSLMVAYAAFALPKAAVALLMAGRGLTDLADGLLGMMSSGMGQQVVMPLVLGVISLVVAYLITKMDGERLFSPGSAA